MLNSIGTTMEGFMVSLAVSVVLGVAIAWIHSFKNDTSKQFAITLALLPVIVQVAITMVGGNVGTGIAVAGTFGLVRFRSVPGDGKDICSVFLAMAVGLANSAGYVWVAILLTFLVGLLNCIYMSTGFGESKSTKRELIITIPESLDYTDIFEDLFESYTKNNELIRVKTSNMGSVYKLTYHTELKDARQEKKFLDELRCRNGNLEIVCGRQNSMKMEL